MTEHHGLDLDALFAANGGHSIFAPSGSAMWLGCSGSLIPNITAPDNAGFDAAEGTVAHAVAEEWLKSIKEELEDPGPEVLCGMSVIDWCKPEYLVGTTQQIKERVETFDILITDEMLAYVRQYIEWCREDPEGDHYIEERVYFSQLTPIPKQGGTADYFVLTPGHMVITDLKYGKGIQVFAKGNTQARLYALGVFFKYDHLYHFEKITIRIAQPRLDHFDEWTITREELLEFADYVKERAAAAWVPNAPRTPSPKACEWCKIKGDCAALLAFVHDSVDDVFEDETLVTVSEDGVIEGVEYSVVEMTSANQLAERQRQIKPDHPSSMSTASMAYILLHRKVIEKWLADIAVELEGRANAGEVVPYHKLVEGREGQRKWKNPKTAPADLEFVGVPQDKVFKTEVVSPAQAEEALKAAYPRLTRKNAGMMIDHLVTRAPGRRTLVPDSDRRPEAEDVGDVFDEIDYDDFPDDDL